MLNFFLPIITLFLLIFVIDLFFRNSRDLLYRTNILSGKIPLNEQQLLEVVQKYGNNSNSFMTLYPGFDYFKSKDPTIPGAIAFLEMSYAWIGGTEPLTSPECENRLLTEFAEAAAKVGKTAVLLPVNQEVAKRASKAGYGSLMIGREPVFDLSFYPKTGNTWIDIIPTAKQLDAKGARIIEISPTQCSQQIKHELDAITTEWLSTRKMDPLGFLNKVEPWTLSEHKKYFYLELSGKILAFLAAIPIWPRRGWYLIDLVRKKDTPAGTTELLTLRSMQLLKNAGAQEVTLGVSPLAQLDSDPSNPKLSAFLRMMYEKGNLFYNFKSLYQYKLKFDPTRCDAAYLIFKNIETQQTHLRLKDVLSIFQAFSRKGLMHATWSGLTRSVKQTHLSELIRNQLKLAVVVRSVPRSWRLLLLRCKFTVSILVFNLVLFFATTESSGLLKSSIEAQWGYRWDTLHQSPVHALALSPFLHWNLTHLNINLILLICFTGGLEYLAGTGFVALCYLIPMILSNPLTSLCLGAMNFPLTELDVGASLGIFGCVGALNGFLRHGIILSASLCGITLIQALVTHNGLVLNHWTALFLGTLIGRLALKK